MMNTKVLGAFAALALLAACESATDTAATGAGAATTGSTIRPGSQEDLIATAGSDRVFFDTDAAASAPTSARRCRSRPPGSAAMPA